MGISLIHQWKHAQIFDFKPISVEKWGCPNFWSMNSEPASAQTCNDPWIGRCPPYPLVILAGYNLFLHHLWMIWVFPKMGVPPKWLVYKGKSNENGWFGGTPISGNHHFEFHHFGKLSYMNSTRTIEKAIRRPLGILTSCAPRRVGCTWRACVVSRTITIKVYKDVIPIYGGFWSNHSTVFY